MKPKLMLLDRREMIYPLTCGFGSTETDCTAPATFHVWYTQINDHSVACDKHFLYICRKNLDDLGFEFHTIGENCTREGSFWHHVGHNGTLGECRMEP